LVGLQEERDGTFGDFGRRLSERRCRRNLKNRKRWSTGNSQNFLPNKK
jgi:hypothetical protein